MRSHDALELIRANPFALVLAYIVANRARWREGFNQHGLNQGEAMLGDFKNYGMSARQYRTAKQHLAKWGFATFRTTHAGTVARLIDTRLFSTDIDAGDKPADKLTTDQRHTSDRPATTNEEGKKEKHAEKEIGFAETPPLSRNKFDELAKMRGVPPDCAEWFWNTHDARNWLDKSGQPIRRVEPLLLNTLKNWRSNTHQTACKQTSSPSPKPQAAAKKFKSEAVDLEKL